MTSNDKIVSVKNRNSGFTFYSIPDLKIDREFAPDEVKNDITLGELRKLYSQPGGDVLIKDCLLIQDEEIAKELCGRVEPEYFYTEAEIKTLLLNGTVEQLKDCLDFAPTGVIDTLKNMAVSLKLNNMSKRQAILDRIGFDVTKAIELDEAKHEVVETEQEPKKTTKTVKEEKPEGRRSEPIKPVIPTYNVVSKDN